MSAGTGRSRIGSLARDVTLGEDACTVSRGQTPQVLAAPNNAILALADRLQIAEILRRNGASLLAPG